MCKVINEDVNNLLKGYRRIDAEEVKSLEAGELAEFLAIGYRLAAEIKSYDEILKKEFLKRGLKLKMVEDQEVKVQIGLGNDSAEFNIKKISENLIPESFLKIVSINQTLVKENLDEEESFVVEKYKKMIPSTKEIVKVSKMSKEELKEIKK